MHVNTFLCTSSTSEFVVFCIVHENKSQLFFLCQNGFFEEHILDRVVIDSIKILQGDRVIWRDSISGKCIIYEHNENVNFKHRQSPVYLLSKIGDASVIDEDRVMIVKEDSIDLYPFASVEEKQVFNSISLNPKCINNQLSTHERVSERSNVFISTNCKYAVFVYLSNQTNIYRIIAINTLNNKICKKELTRLQIDLESVDIMFSPNSLFFSLAFKLKDSEENKLLICHINSSRNFLARSDIRELGQITSMSFDRKNYYLVINLQNDQHVLFNVSKVCNELRLFNRNVKFSECIEFSITDPGNYAFHMFCDYLLNINQGNLTYSRVSYDPASDKHDIVDCSNIVFPIRSTHVENSNNQPSRKRTADEMQNESFLIKTNLKNKIITSQSDKKTRLMYVFP